MDFVRNLLLFLAVKEFWKSVNNWQSYRRELGVLLFLGHSIELFDSHSFPVGFPRVRCVDDGALRALLSEGKELQYTDSPAYVQLSRVIDTVDTCADIVQWFSADKLADW